MKVLQKIVRFVSILIGILFKHYKRGSYWCIHCKNSKVTLNGDDSHPCQNCMTRGAKLGSYYYEKKPTRFTKTDKESED